MARTLEQIIASEKPEVVAMAREQADIMLFNIHLVELAERTQMDTTVSLRVKQPAISEMEPTRDSVCNSVRDVD